MQYPWSIFDGGDHDELYDLVADPDETCNLACVPAHRETVAVPHARLLDWLATSHLAVTVGRNALAGASRNPIFSDDTTPNPIQPRHRRDNMANQL